MPNVFSAASMARHVDAIANVGLTETARLAAFPMSVARAASRSWRRTNSATGAPFSGT